MGDCGCNKNGKPTGFGSYPQQEQQGVQALMQQQPLNGAQLQAVESGTQASFTLRDRSGKVQHFGSQLERNAFIARQGGTILP